MDAFDAVIIGSGDNALGAGAFAARAGGGGPALAKLLKDFEPHVEPVFGLLGAELASEESAKVIHRLMHNRHGGFSDFAHLFTRTARDLLTQTFASPVLRSALAPWALHL